MTAYTYTDVADVGLLHTEEINLVHTGVVANAYPVMTIKDICMAKANKVQNPFPQEITISNGLDGVRTRAMINAIIVNTNAMTYESGTHLR